MKRVFIPAFALAFSAAALFFTLEQGALSKGHGHGGGHGAMMMGAAMKDERRELKLPAAMKVMQKEMMRRHLDTVADITAALAANDTAAAAEAARVLGWSPQEEQRCSKVEKMTGESGFVELGMAVHKKADELVVAAQEGRRDDALRLLAELINNCNACHKTFRH
ncbi:MAG TPA: hypothetical protein ENJ37_05845 [Deltaproteobacteria bacterium]|nr:hypothetical protein [Deltaproteobacteria bacterium]